MEKQKFLFKNTDCLQAWWLINYWIDNWHKALEPHPEEEPTWFGEVGTSENLVKFKEQYKGEYFFFVTITKKGNNCEAEFIQKSWTYHSPELFSYILNDCITRYPGIVRADNTRNKKIDPKNWKLYLATKNLAKTKSEKAAIEETGIPKSTYYEYKKRDSYLGSILDSEEAK